MISVLPLVGLIGIMGRMLDNFTITHHSNEYDLNIDVKVEDSAWLKVIKNTNLEQRILELSQHIFLVLGLNKYAKHIEFSITLTDNEHIQRLNAQYRNKDRPTNSLSFPAQDIAPGKLEKVKFYDGFAILGDIIFAYDFIAVEAIQQQKSFHNHLMHLLTHAILHLLGYDHIIESDAMKMEALEVEVLSYFGIKSPYESI